VVKVEGSEGKVLARAGALEVEADEEAAREAASEVALQPELLPAVMRLPAQ
jgi:hypothetical protein